MVKRQGRGTEGGRKVASYQIGTLPWFKAVATDAIRRAHEGQLSTGAAKQMCEACRVGAEMALVLKQYPHLNLHEGDASPVIEKGREYQHRRTRVTTGGDGREKERVEQVEGGEPEDESIVDVDYEQVV